MKTTYKVVYHNSDFDGLASAAIILKWLQEVKIDEPKKIETFGFDYGYDKQIAEFVDGLNAGEIVIMADFSLKPELMQRVTNVIAADSFIFIDHHKGAIDDLEKANLSNLPGKRDIKLAASRLCWEYFFKDVKLPLAIDYLSKYDIFNLSDENVVPFQRGLNTYDTTLDSPTWGTIFKSSRAFIDEVIERGNIIKTYFMNYQYPAIAKNAFPIVYRGYSGLMVNDGTKGSDSLTYTTKRGVYDFYCNFRYCGQIDKWSVSFYAGKTTGTRNSDVDCAALARNFMGNGHLGAAGCEMDTSTFMHFLSTTKV